MILPDINLLLYAYNEGAPLHRRARAWWEQCLSHPEPVGLPWVVLLGYVRLTTGPALLTTPKLPPVALGHVRAWLERPNVQVLNPGPRHLDLLEALAAEAGIAGKLTTDLHLAALAIENRATLCSNDNDFARFSGLRWSNPLA
jgi:uncharacterized protein